MDKHAFRRHRIVNTVQTVLLLSGMSLLLGALGWFLGGWSGVLFALGVVAVTSVFAPRVSPRFILRLYNARELHAAQAPELFAIFGALVERAQLPSAPTLYFVPTPIINAFAVGSPGTSAVALTAGLLDKLNARELAGVLAHELSHIRNNDMNVMSLADIFSRVTSMLSTAGQILLLVNLPLMLSGAQTIHWMVILVLLIAPLLSAVIQRGLSRTREYDADVGAVELTGDAVGMASALAKIDRYQGRFFEQIWMPGHRVPDPSLLRTHPPTQARIARLYRLAGSAAPEPLPPPPGTARLRSLAGLPVRARPRWRMSGIWY